VLVILGTSEVEGEIRLYGQNEIATSQKGLIFFKPDEPLYALVGDNYIMRLITPMVTLGGGKVLDQLKNFPRRKRLADYTYLEARLEANTEKLILTELQKRLLAEADSLLEEADLSREEITAEVERLVTEKKLGRFGNFIYHPVFFERAIDRLRKNIETYLSEQPHLKGITFEQTARLASFGEETARVFIEYLVQTDRLVRTVDLYNLPGRGMSLKGVIKEAHDKIIAALEAEPYAPPSLSELAGKGKIYQQAIKYMLDTGEVYKCGADFLFLTDIWREIIVFIRNKLNTDGKLAVSELRDRFGFTRKFVIPILEETDRSGLTKREGDIRIKGDRFENEELAL
jgi:selenocysteine-specific elongation factor